MSAFAVLSYGPRRRAKPTVLPMDDQLRFRRMVFLGSVVAINAGRFNFLACSNRDERIDICCVIADNVRA